MECCQQKKKSTADKKLEKLVSELKELHGQQYTPMQYRIWGEMIRGRLYSSKTESPNSSMFSKAGGKEPKRKSEVTEAIGEVAKQMSAAFSGALPVTSCTSTVPAKKIDNRSKCYKQLSDVKDLRGAGVLTEEEYQSEKRLL